MPHFSAQPLATIHTTHGEKLREALTSSSGPGCSLRPCFPLQKVSVAGVGEDGRQYVRLVYTPPALLWYELVNSPPITTDEKKSSATEVYFKSPFATEQYGVFICFARESLLASL